MVEWVFWLSVIVLVYTYTLYPFILFCWIAIRKKINTKIDKPILEMEWPTVAVIVAAYNEEKYIEAKIKNSLALNYPKDKLTYIVVTDGSSDNTYEIAMAFPQIKVIHQKQRAGKLMAMKRAVAEAEADILVFTDANSMLNVNCLEKMIPHFKFQKVGAVSGEKRVLSMQQPDAMIGEGIYWKYESWIKKLESQFYTVIGMPGELFAIRKSLFPILPSNTITEDFLIAMRVIANGYYIQYEPSAIAAENPSNNIISEFKRKKRIAAGSIQTFLYTLHLCNPIKYPTIAFQYISHKVFRWILIPFLLPILLISTIYLWHYAKTAFFALMILLQTLFYILALIGWCAEHFNISIRWLYIPFYYCFMNVAMLWGIVTFLSGKHTVLWEKAIRK
jgi:cellulose synthase/poly-beta-1,6-N-acetylglucosamine synthase-like glycosyltransferase